MSPFFNILRGDIVSKYKYRAALRVAQIKRDEDMRDDRIDQASSNIPNPYIMPDGTKIWSFGGDNAVYNRESA